MACGILISNNRKKRRSDIKFGNIHKELSQTIDEARTKIEVPIEGRLSITIRNTALDQDVVQ
jgi:hypothetical protein